MESAAPRRPLSRLGEKPDLYADDLCKYIKLLDAL